MSAVTYRSTYFYHFIFFSILGAVAVTLEQSQHRERESVTMREKRDLKVQLKEMELAQQQKVKTLMRVSATRL